MAVEFDSAEPATLPDQLAAFVDAVTGASASDEHGWIEWKSGYDLASKTGKGILARHILGMANRMPDAATLHCGGWGMSSPEPNPAVGWESHRWIRLT